MRKILGLDLGVSSLGWALVQENDGAKKEIIALGSRIVPLATEDKDEFSSGNAISKNQNRTAKRTQRKGYDRYQLRRENLKKLMAELDISPDAELFKTTALELFALRNKSVSEKISLKELGRVLYHINQKRGYKSSRTDDTGDKKETNYVAEIKNRYDAIKKLGLTVGQYFYEEISKNNFQRIKQQVFPREAYIEEFNAICKTQQKYYPNILTDKIISSLRDEIIYYQRQLKSQKGLVNVCDFAGFFTKDKTGKEIFVGPKVTPKSSPLFQVCKIWETINTITLKNKRGDIYNIPLEKKIALFDYLDNNEKLTQSELFKILELKASDGWYGNKQISKGIQGNITKVAIQKILNIYEECEHLSRFNLTIQKTEKESFLVDNKTGELKHGTYSKFIDPNFEHQPIYQLWHIIYSVPDWEECASALRRKFDIPEDAAKTLSKLDFTKFGFGNKSAKAIRQILPYLMDGFVYSEACTLAGYNHSNSLTNDENFKRKLSKSIPLLPKNSLRQPIVEKILNQLINLVNAIIEKYGTPDEIRVELARELKQSKDERNETFSAMNKRERENKTIIERIEREYKHFGIRATRNTIIKWRLFTEINNDESKINASCIYCGQPFGITEALSGRSVDVEHIIPKSRMFDDSQSNKTLVHRKCNEDKGDKTAFDFMQSKGEAALQRYLETINALYKDGIIGKSKRDKLLMTGDKIPKDFIDRQLRETQYISRKAKEILDTVCYKVWSTSGNVTEYLRRIWGWNDVLMNLQLPKYRELGLTEWVEWETNDGYKRRKEVIKDWTKRDDHRHHAIDALVIACTEQGFIQKINNLNANTIRDKMKQELEANDKNYDYKKSLMENYFFSVVPFTTSIVENFASKILISFKAGKRVATLSKYKATGKNVSKGVLVPRGSLSEESVYGKIKFIEKNKPLKYLFENPHLIFKPYIKALVENRLNQFDNPKLAILSTKKEPIYLDGEKTRILEYGTCYKEEYVIKYPIENFKQKDVIYIIDEKIKKIIADRLTQFGNNPKEAFKDLENNPVWYNKEKGIRIKSVRCLTGLSAVEAVKKDEEGNEIGFVKPGNNHNICIYKDESGKRQELVCSFWHAVERKKYGIPVIIKNPKEVWDKILTNSENYPQQFLAKLPSDKFIFEESLQQNEFFILGLTKEDVEKAIFNSDNKTLSNHLYRVQKIATLNYMFRHHLETKIDDSNEAKTAKRFIHIRSIPSFYEYKPVKIAISNLGEIQKTAVNV